MQRLPIVVQKWNNFIWEKPQVVVKILEKNGIKVSSKPTLPELIKKSMVGVANGNEGLINDIDYVIENGDYNGLVILTAIAIGTSIASTIIGAVQGKKMRKAQLNIALMNLASNEKLTYANIQAMKEQGRIDILTNTVETYSIALQQEATLRQKDTALFIGIMGVGLAVLYSAIQVFK
jgi:hypothetical protein